MSLPNCELVNVLKQKADLRADIDFGRYIRNLEDFREVISDQISFINQLFPEYTPHDEKYHITNLFHIADKILERKRYEKMNSTELLVLAISLYGHDWGMAVSDAEKEYITTGVVRDGCDQAEFSHLPDEKLQMQKFAKKNSLKLNSDGRFGEIGIESWRDYVRQTHAIRSALKVYKYFERIDSGIADAASRICLGHALDIEKLQARDRYPTDFAVLSETMNIRALAIYLRLIDLFDFADDRTPYIIWKFVAPKDPISKMEWKKHRALRPITCPHYQEGRTIHVDGSTDDHEVYAALKDLNLYCETQLRECNDALAMMRDPRHKLDIYHIDWRVAANGFEPVSIQFEFNRKRMFEILGDEIYDGDPYVFLRELLQNSIDAIRMRREVLKKQDISMNIESQIIKVKAEHNDNGDSLITWSDEGIGMDEYIVRNYLAVAGKSYYRSEDFEREEIKIDPISRFGIGILSCFMVANKVEINTYKDPYHSSGCFPLFITIPSIGNYRVFKSYSWVC